MPSQDDRQTNQSPCLISETTRATLIHCYYLAPFESDPLLRPGNPLTALLPCECRVNLAGFLNRYHPPSVASQPQKGRYENFPDPSSSLLSLQSSVVSWLIYRSGRSHQLSSVIQHTACQYPAVHLLSSTHGVDLQ